MTWAVLIDTVSIQRYVFAINKLKENLGASYLIQKIYEEPLEEVIRSTIPSTNNYDFKLWEKNQEEVIIKKSAEFEIGYVGGGNALLLFKEKEKAETFIREWTRKLLLECPGITTAVACKEINIDDSAFKEEKQRLFDSLKKNKAEMIPQTIIPRHGITAECPRTGYSMDIWSGDLLPKNDRGYVSSVSYAKLLASKKAREALEERYLQDKLLKEFCFTDELDRLGQSKGEDSHIAIVHIDGNGMGRRFQNTETLPEIRKLSKTVRNSTEASFRAMLGKVASNFEKIREYLGFVGDRKGKYPKQGGKYILPILPIIIGGDDITFVTEGRLGIYLAKVFMEEFEIQNASDGKPLSACAGIAITKTKYPFYRGYELSEELCKNAKEVRKKKKDEGSWLDFHIAYGGFSGGIKEIRQRHYRIQDGELTFRPYKIGSNEEHGLELLIKNTRYLKYNFPNSKVKELREIATMGKARAKLFIDELRARGLSLPEIKGKNYNTYFFENNRTPYFDMVELIDIYPLEF